MNTYLNRNFSLLSICFFLFLAGNLTAQQDFNHYKSLIASGSIPPDFSATTAEKIKNDKGTKQGSLSGKKEKVFLEGIHYSIDGILHSGMVLYGDEITKYVTEIAGRLLVDEPELKNTLRFYTVKSNATNAFSTDQGIIFVTTGLIAQLDNEAQLAYVLGHEIAHYQLKHVVETFDYKTNNSRRDITIEKLSQYSKEKEFQADKAGIKFFHDAGYDKSELISTFDVLHYSYLPFDEIPFNKTYLNSSYISIPEEFFPKQKYDIKAIENDDDSKSSHPNIFSRKSASEAEAQKYSDWKTRKFNFGEERFHYIRNLARFETVRKDVMNCEYTDALYSIYILEKEFPNSEYLKSMKAKSWLGIAQLTEKRRLSNYLVREKDLEGEIASLHYLFRKLNKNVLYTVAIRQIYDIYKQNPENKEIAAIWNKTIQEIARSGIFNLEEYSKLTYAEAKEEFEKNKVLKDSSENTPKEEVKLSKYERIKKKKDLQDPDNFDASKFYIYALGDLIQDEGFRTSYLAYKEEYNKEKQQEEAYKRMSKKEKKEYYKKMQRQQYSFDITDVIIVEPVVNQYKKGVIDRVKSDQLAQSLASSIDMAAKDAQLNITIISRYNLLNQGTPGYNERAILTSYLSQLSMEKEIEPFPVDYELIQDVHTNYGTSKVLFTLLEHNYSPRVNAGILLSPIYCPPCATVLIPLAFLRGNHTEFSFLLMDIEKGSILGGHTNYYRNPVNKYTMGAYVYDLFEQFKSKPANNKK